MPSRIHFQSSVQAADNEFKEKGPLRVGWGDVLLPVVKWSGGRLSVQQKARTFE